MKLVSCNGCGIVIDADKRKFPDVDELEEEELTTKAEWDGDRYVACINCPICGYRIQEPS